MCALERAGFYGLAEHEAKVALAILEENFGPADVSLVPALNVLSETYFSEGRYAEAIQAGERAVSIGPDAGAHHLVAVRNLRVMGAAR